MDKADEVRCSKCGLLLKEGLNSYCIDCGNKSQARLDREESSCEADLRFAVVAIMFFGAIGLVQALYHFGLIKP
jgi:hypothetical protein